MNERLKILRKNLGLTLEKFGARINVKSSVVSCWETSRQTIPDYRIYQICHEFGVNSKWLETGEGEMFSMPKSADELDAEAFVRVLTRLIGELSHRSRKIALEAAKRIVKELGESTDQPL